jgi:hypothetical protein
MRIMRIRVRHLDNHFIICCDCLRGLHDLYHVHARRHCRICIRVVNDMRINSLITSCAVAATLVGSIGGFLWGLSLAAAALLTAQIVYIEVIRAQLKFQLDRIEPETAATPAHIYTGAGAGATPPLHHMLNTLT